MALAALAIPLVLQREVSTYLTIFGFISIFGYFSIFDDIHHTIDDLLSHGLFDG